MPDLNVSAEEFLISLGIFQKGGVQRRKILTCIACRWAICILKGEEPKFYGYQIHQCTGLRSGFIQPILTALENRITVTAFDIGSIDHLKGPRRKYHQPAQTSEGLHFMKLLEPPKTCPLMQAG